MIVPSSSSTVPLRGNIIPPFDIVAVSSESLVALKLMCGRDVDSFSSQEVKSGTQEGDMVC